MRSYATNLRKGRIENPGYEKVDAIAKTVGFSPELWFDDNFDLQARVIAKPAEETHDIAGKVNYLLEVIRNEQTGEAYTNAEVACRSLGELTARDESLTTEEIRRLRSGEVPNPYVNQVAALADFFGVQPSYFVDSK
jgi:hypothetical protein